MVAAVVVIAAFVVTLVISGDDDEQSADPTSSGPEEPGSDEPSSGGSQSEEPTTSDPATGSPSDGTTTTDPQIDPNVEPGDGSTITGDGYTFTLPDAAWTDVTDEAGKIPGGGSIDTFVVLGSSIAVAQSNVIVEAIPSPASSPEELEALWKRNVSSSDGATTVDIPDIEIDGERAIGIEVPDRSNNAGVPLTQIVYLTLHGGTQYSIGLSYPRSGDSISKGDFEKLLASWTWTA